MSLCDWSSDVCSSDLTNVGAPVVRLFAERGDLVTFFIGSGAIAQSTSTGVAEAKLMPMADGPYTVTATRSEERRVGKECRAGCSAYAVIKDWSGASKV